MNGGVLAWMQWLPSPAPGRFAAVEPGGPEEQGQRNSVAGAPVIKREYLTELFSIGLLSDVKFSELLFDTDKREKARELRLGVLSCLSRLLGGSLEDTEVTLKLFQNLDQSSYEKIVRNTRTLRDYTPFSLSLRDIKTELDSGERYRTICCATPLWSPP